MNTEDDKVKNAANSPDSPWRPDDPTWMFERIAEWRKIQKRLAGATQHIPRSYWKHLKAYFFPCVDSDKEIDIPRSLSGRCCSPPRFVVQWCLGSTMAEIRSYDVEPVSSTKKGDYAYIAHEPGLVLWDHFSAAMDKGKKALYGDVERLQEYQRVQFESNKKRLGAKFDRTLMGVLTFFDRDKNNDSRQRPLTVKHVEYLLGRYENREFSDPLLSRWDRAKGLIKPGRAL